MVKLISLKLKMSMFGVKKPIDYLYSLNSMSIS